MASFAAVDKVVAESKADENAQITNIDVSTVSYMFDLANKIPDESILQKSIIERHESFHISSLRPHAVFSIRFGTLDENGAEGSRLWAQRHVLAQNGKCLL